MTTIPVNVVSELSTGFPAMGSWTGQCWPIQYNAIIFISISHAHHGGGGTGGEQRVGHEIHRYIIGDALYQGLNCLHALPEFPEGRARRFEAHAVSGRGYQVLGRY